MNKYKYREQVIFITAIGVIFFMIGAWMFWFSFKDASEIRLYTFLWGVWCAALWGWFFSRIPRPEPKKYLVVWTERKLIPGGGGEVDRDGYEAFIDGDNSEENRAEAQKLYERVLGMKDTYCVHICEVVESTDYK